MQKIIMTKAGSHGGADIKGWALVALVAVSMVAFGAAMMFVAFSAA